MKNFLNDYELIYSIKDGNEKSLEIMLFKYDPFIIKYVTSLRGYIDEDLIQEGRLVLYNCIYDYSERSPHSFFSYFSMCCKRRLRYLAFLEDRYHKTVLLREIDDPIYQSPIDNIKKPIIPLIPLKDELDMKIYEECIIKGDRIVEFAKNHKMDYNKVYNRYRILIALISQNL